MRDAVVVLALDFCFREGWFGGKKSQSMSSCSASGLMSGRLRQELIKRYAAAFLKDAATIAGGAKRIIEGGEAASVCCQQTDLDISGVCLVSLFCLFNSNPSLYVVLGHINSRFEGILQRRFDEKCG